MERGIKAGKSREQVFPRLGKVGAEVTGEGPTVKVKFVKTGDALPVRVVRDGEAVDAAAVREVDLLKKYHWTSSKIAEKLKLSTPRAAALREHLGIDKDEDCTYSAAQLAAADLLQRQRVQAHAGGHGRAGHGRHLGVAQQGQAACPAANLHPAWLYQEDGSDQGLLSRRHSACRCSGTFVDSGTVRP